MVKQGNVPTAAEIGRMGGRNSRKNLTEAQRKELARRAAKARWEKWRRAQAAAGAVPDKKKVAKPKAAEKKEPLKGEI